MTPQERQLVDDLFDRLARLETAPRDPDAERTIIDGLRRAPNAVYALVQTALVQDEALKRADARIRELSGAGDATHESPGFLDSMREAFVGRTRTSVPSVRPGAANETDPRWNQGGAYPNASAAQASPSGVAPAQGANSGAGFGGGGSFLGTAAAAAAGMIGGSLLLNSISSMFGNRGGGSAFGAVPPASSWDTSASNSDLARDAGLNDVGGSGAVSDPQTAGLFGNDASDSSDDLAGDPGGDFDGGGDFGGGDTA